MARLILLVILLSTLFYTLRFLIKSIISPRKNGTCKTDGEELVQDPYCQVYVPKSSAVKKRVAGRDIYFCNQECLRKYLNAKKD